MLDWEVGVGVRGEGEGVHDRSLTWCLPMILARWRDARFMARGELGRKEKSETVLALTD